MKTVTMPLIQSLTVSNTYLVKILSVDVMFYQTYIILDLIYAWNSIEIFNGFSKYGLLSERFFNMIVWNTISIGAMLKVWLQKIISVYYWTWSLQKHGVFWKILKPVEMFRTSYLLQLIRLLVSLNFTIITATKLWYRT